MFENFNQPDTPFTNDQILDIMRQHSLVDDAITIDDLEGDFESMCDSGLIRNIAQNFTTMWFKLFDVIEELHCDKCGGVHLGSQEGRACPVCGTSLV